MANNNWLRANWLALSIFIAILGLGVTWGVTQNQQKTNTVEIEKKLDKEVFKVYADQWVETSAEIKTSVREQRIEQRADMKEIKELIRAR